jgi:hypothetical protein
MTNEPHTVRIVQMLTEQGVMPYHGVLLYMMNSVMTDKTMTGAEEQVSIIGGDVRATLLT